MRCKLLSDVSFIRFGFELRSGTKLTLMVKSAFAMLKRLGRQATIHFSKWYVRLFDSFVQGSWPSDGYQLNIFKLLEIFLPKDKKKKKLCIMGEGLGWAHILSQTFCQTSLVPIPSRILATLRPDRLSLICLKHENNWVLFNRNESSFPWCSQN